MPSAKVNFSFGSLFYNAFSVTRLYSVEPRLECMKFYLHTPVHLHDNLLKHRDKYVLILGGQVLANKLETFIEN
jgi:hypothetical protein